ncbi:MAG: hypothetical protein LAN64_10720 [Acidobacteriia bacterium]|nr:hypothetical protein [Terriglobia bacterium]
MALILALLILLTLSALTASLISTTQTEIWTTTNYRVMTQARYAAEAGAQRAALWLANPNDDSTMYTAPTSYSGFTGTNPVQDTSGHAIILTADGATTAYYPDTTIKTNFANALTNQSVPNMSGATFAVTATLISQTAGTPPAQVWEINSTGSIAGVRSAKVSVRERIERVVSSTPAYAVFATSTACSALTFSGNVTTDSFNSDNGTYAATRANSGGDMGTNGSLLASGSPGVTIHGAFSSPLGASKGACPANSYNWSGSGSIDNGVTHLSAAWTPPPPMAPTGTPTSSSIVLGSGCSKFPAGSCSGSGGNITLNPGTYNALISSGTATVHLTGGSSSCNVYNFYSLTTSGSFAFAVDSGKVCIVFTSPSSPITASGSWLSNSSGVPSNLQINYSGTGNFPLSGSSATYAIVNAPNAPVTVSGSNDWYGSIIAKSVTASGGAKFHYDQALGSSTASASKFHVSWFNWNKF